MKHLSEKYLQSCRDRAYSADPTGKDVVIKDLRKRINKLIRHIQELQIENNKAGGIYK